MFEFKHQYDALGNRTQTILPGGRKLNHLFHGSGHAAPDQSGWPGHQRLRARCAVPRGASQSGPIAQRVCLRPRRSPHCPAGPARLGRWPPPHRSTGLASPAFPTPARRRRAILQGRLKGVIERHYQYDASGQLVQWLDRHRGLTRYRYDEVGRITRSQIGLIKDWGTSACALTLRATPPAIPWPPTSSSIGTPPSNPLPAEAAGAPGSPGNFVPATACWSGKTRATPTTSMAT